MRYWSVPPEWTKETCFILAGGPSLRGCDVWRLQGRGRVIAINDSYRLAPWADVLYFCDVKWWRRWEQDITARFIGRYIVTMGNEVPMAKTLRQAGELGLELDPSGLRHGSNGGFQAINLAYHFGANRIVLLGYDMKVKDFHTHWHGGHPGQNAQDFAPVLDMMRPKFQSLVEPLKAAGVEVLNATPDSALDCWPKIQLRTLL